MKSRPILFSAPMIQAILDGRKTQTRRIVKPQPDIVANRGTLVAKYTPDDERLGRLGQAVLCPYGQPGDQLWVREAFAYSVIDPDGLSVEDDPENYDIIYRATGKTDGGWTDGCGATIKAPWKPSIHMPRWASRITLEIVSVRVERLQDISEADAIAEGVNHSLHLPGGRFANENYAHLWWQINGDGSWESNPWVWALKFKRIEN